MNSKIIDTFSQQTILVFGDVMLDRYVYGNIERISPESPVPVVEFESESYMPGGAANAAVNIVSVGGRAILCGVVGKGDESSSILRKTLESNDITTDFVEEKGRITTEKTRVIGQRNHQVIRIDREDKSEISADSEKQFLEKVPGMVSKADGVLIADYNKGVVTSDICQQIITLAKKKNIPVVVDPKGRDYRKYRGSGVLKPNIRELEDVSGECIRSAEDMKNVLLSLMRELEIEGIVLTRGSRGVSTIDKTGKVMNIPASAKEVFDVCGAGDTFASILVLSLAAGASLFEAAELANIAAGIVVTKAGTSSVSKREMESALEASETSESKKIVDYETLKRIVEDLRAKGTKIVFTNGCFDLLHYGHVRYLQHARQRGDYLIVAINADETVKKIKGEGRPVMPQDVRAHLLAGLQCVDAVLIFYEEKPLKYLRELKPDVLVKGSDYTREGVVGHEIVDGYGGEIYLAPLESGWSTTEVIERIQKNTKINKG